MSRRRRVRSGAQSSVVVGWTEVWGTTADGFTREGNVPIARPALKMTLGEDGQYRLRARRPLVLPREAAS